MEKIIATELPPHGLDNDVLDYLERDSSELSLDDAIVYYGFPVFKDYEDLSVKSKFAILSPVHGLILLYTSNIHDLEGDDDNLGQLYSFVEASMKKSKILRRSKRELKVNLDSYLYAQNATDSDSLDNDVLSSLLGIKEILNDCALDNAYSQDIFDEVRSIVEGAKALSRASKRMAISEDPTTKLNVLIALENEVSNFDLEQRKVAISLINGPQRIRGLAGSGKTVVLAMKAAHIHLQHADKKILFTFYTKSLYGLIRESIAHFYRHFAGSEPNWDNIDILHSWGGKSIEGVYYNACLDNSVPNMTLQDAKVRNFNDPFSAACADLICHDITPKYDYILVDEAQDLPNEFFRMCYKLAVGDSGRNKNIVWAYDELQSIFNVYQRTPEELFGADETGKPLVDLKLFRENLSYGQGNDLVLYKCYRNPLEILLTAHALGFGLYSEKPVQMLENEDHWRDVGYNLVDGSLDVGTQVTITRDRENSPLSIYEYQAPDQVLQCYRSSSLQDECQWIANNIKSAINEGLRAHDIMVIVLDDRLAKRYFSEISLLLSEVGIRSNNLLVSYASAPPFKLDDMVTLSTVHRAKGNEAAMVFAAGMDAIYPSRQTRSGRNKIFTAFTRTKAWLRVSGWGDKAQLFFNEITMSLANSPSLIFNVPDSKEIECIQRDLDSRPQEITKLQNAVGELRDMGYSEEEIQEQMELMFATKDDE